MSILINLDYNAGTDPVNEVQVISISTGASSGTFSLNGDTVTYVDVLATLETNIQASLDSFFGSGNAVITGSAIVGPNYEYTVEFQSGLAGADQSEMTISDIDTGATMSVSTTTDGDPGTYGYNNFTFTPPATTGEWTLDGITYQFQDTPSVSGFTILGTAADGSITCDYTTIGATTPLLTYDAGTLDAIWTAAVDLISEPALLDSSASFAAGTKTASVSLTAKTLNLASSVDVDNPVASASLSSSPSSLSSGVEFDVPVYTGSSSLTAKTLTLTTSMLFLPGTKTAATTLTSSKTLIAAIGTFEVPVSTVTVELVSIRSILRAMEVVPSSGPKLYVTGGRKTSTLYGVSDGKFKFSIGGHSVSKRTHTIHLVQVKPEIVTVAAQFQVLTLSSFIPAGGFRYESEGGFLSIVNTTDIELTLVPDEGGDQFVNTDPTDPSITYGSLFATFHESQY